MDPDPSVACKIIKPKPKPGENFETNLRHYLRENNQVAKIEKLTAKERQMLMVKK